MAKTLVFEIEIDDKGAVKSLNNIEKGVEDIGQASEKTAKDVKGVGTSIGSIVKAAGIVGLLVKAFEFLVDALRQNQTVVDALSTATKAIQIVFNDLVDFALDTVIPTLKLLFNNGEEGAKGFGNALKLQVGGALESLVKGVALATTAIQLFFNGQIKAAEIFAKDAAKAFADFGEKAIDTTINYTKEVIENAKALTEAEKASRLLELQQTRLREQYDRDAEQQRQIRDDVSRGIDERIEANRRLGEILEEQQKLEQATVNQRIANLQREQDQLGFKQERYEEIYSLQTELIAIEAQQAGFRSEQLTNENSLLKEKEDLLQSYRDAEAEYEAEQAVIRQKKIEQDKKDAADEIQLANDVAEAKVQSAIAGLNIAKSLAKEGSELSKALAVTEATTSTFAGAVNAFKSAAASSITTVFPAYPFIQAASAVAFGLANVKSILSTKTNGTTATSAPSGAAFTPPTFQIPGTEINQLGDTITEGINGRPVKAYVVGSDVTTQQQLDRATRNNTIL